MAKEERKYDELWGEWIRKPKHKPWSKKPLYNKFVDVAALCIK